jgi:hypothetical protein
MERGTPHQLTMPPSTTIVVTMPHSSPLTRAPLQGMGLVVESELGEVGVSGHYALLMGHGPTRKRKQKLLTVSPSVEEVELPPAHLRHLQLPESAQPWEVLQAVCRDKEQAFLTQKARDALRRWLVCEDNVQLLTYLFWWFCAHLFKVRTASPLGEEGESTSVGEMLWRMGTYVAHSHTLHQAPQHTGAEFEAAVAAVGAEERARRGGAQGGAAATLRSAVRDAERAVRPPAAPPHAPVRPVHGLVQHSAGGGAGATLLQHLPQVGGGGHLRRVVPAQHPAPDPRVD